MALELLLLPEVSAIFNKTVRSYVADLLATGEIPSAAVFQDVWRGTFQKHYRRVARSFLDNQRQSKFIEALLETKQELAPGENDVLQVGFALWALEFGREQVGFLLGTTQEQYAEALARSTELNEGASRAVVAAGAGVILRQLFNGREGTIVNVQTQAPAEESKRREAGALRVSEGELAEDGQKEWQTVGDSAVRTAHRSANRQRRPTNAAFTVAGQSLRYPGDRSLGASLSNVINCRCNALYL